SGVENVNHEVDRLLDLGRLRRVLAQVEVVYPNSMIEAWWRSLKHSWLYLHTLDSRAAVESLVAFYVEQHNSVMPHAAIDGRTPDEVYFGTPNNLADELAAGRRQARAERLVNNRAIACSECASQGPPAEVVSRDAA
ncbi:MAG: transposase, partial [Polyangiaceae bacterium]|nr:transposase [Polyangiaceae bacterium]